MPKLTDFHAALAECAQLSAHARATHVRIQQAAESRFSLVNARIESLRPHALADPRAARDYQAAIEERGTLLRLLTPAES